MAISSTMIAAALAGGDVVVTTSLDPNTAQRGLSTGEVAVLELTMAGQDQAGVCAVDLTLTCETDEILIRSVTFNPVFSIVFEGSAEALPAGYYRCVRAQDLRGMNRKLAARGREEPLATVEIEAVGASPVASGIEVDVEVVTIGGARNRTVTRLSPEDAGRSGPRNVSLGPQPDDPAPEPAPAEPPMLTQYAPLTLEVQPLGGGWPVTDLEPRTTYELHYTSGASAVAGYAAFVVSATPSISLMTATTPDLGDWARTGNFFWFDMNDLRGEPQPAVDYPNGYYRYFMFTDDIYTNQEYQLADPDGYLCNFTTGEPGDLNLHAYMYRDDLDARQVVEMEAQLSLTVDDSIGREP